ncbi:MAG: hypothetical protein RR162_05630 [Oscillospiraceae bacterium]
MEVIARLIGTLCMASFIMSILMNFGKFEATEKVIRFVISIFIIVTIFKPYSIDNVLPSFDFTELTIEKQVVDQEAVNNLVIEKTRENLTELVKMRLRQKNISYIALELHILNQDGNLSIDKITLTGCKETQREKINRCLEDLIDNETKVILGD